MTMDKLQLLSRIKKLYSENVNIIQYLKSIAGSKINSIEDIMISYDFQAGSYIKNYKNNTAYYHEYGQYLANTIQELGDFDSLLEAGAGEGTTLGPLYLSLQKRPTQCYGFDISCSRIKYAKRFLSELQINNIKPELFM